MILRSVLIQIFFIERCYSIFVFCHSSHKRASSFWLHNKLTNQVSFGVHGRSPATVSKSTTYPTYMLKRPMQIDIYFENGWTERGLLILPYLSEFIYYCRSCAIFTHFSLYFTRKSFQMNDFFSFQNCFYLFFAHFRSSSSFLFASKLLCTPKILKTIGAERNSRHCPSIHLNVKRSSQMKVS